MRYGWPKREFTATGLSMYCVINYMDIIIITTTVAIIPHNMPHTYQPLLFKFTVILESLTRPNPVQRLQADTIVRYNVYINSIPLCLIITHTHTHTG